MRFLDRFRRNSSWGRVKVRRLGLIRVGGLEGGVDGDVLRVEIVRSGGDGGNGLGSRSLEGTVFQLVFGRLLWPTGLVSDLVLSLSAGGTAVKCAAPWSPWDGLVHASSRSSLCLHHE